MGRLHPSNYLEIGTRSNRIGETSGQYNTLGGQLALLPPSLRGFGRLQRTATGYGLGQANPFGCLMPGVVGTGPQCTTDQILAQMGTSSQALIAAGATPADVGTGTGLSASDIAAINALNLANPVVGPGSGNFVISNQTLLLIAGGFVLLLLLTGRR
jgi:hypothetical protein